MKISSEWPRIIGLHADSGQLACVWMAQEKLTGKIFLYDSALFDRVVFAVIAERLGDKIPIAWESSAEELVKRLKKRGCKITREGYKESQVLAEATAREIWSQMEAKKFLVGSHNEQWFNERERFWLADGGAVPMDNFPLMSATRHAMANLSKAKQVKGKARELEYDTRGII